jgi:hypothetical protein
MAIEDATSGTIARHRRPLPDPYAGLRRTAWREYLIYDRPSAHRMEIARVLHGRHSISSRLID